MKMLPIGVNRGLVLTRGYLALGLLTLVTMLPGCHRKLTGGEAATGQKTFASPEEAANALVNAAKTDNQAEMLAIFGPGSKDVIYSGNAEDDKAAFAGFVSAYNAMNRWRKLDNGNRLLLVGAANDPFPIPLRPDRSSKWYFDTAAGKSEMVVRRVGRNELATIDVMAALADAQTEYYGQAHDGVKQYAQKFISDPGKQNGLYWPSVAGKPKSPIGPLVAFATPQGAMVQSDLHRPFHGYYFAMLGSQGANVPGGLKDYIRGGIMNRGFAFVAYPAEYGKTGTMTFLVDHDRVIHQKDLGPTTRDDASIMVKYNPDYGWVEVKQ